MLYIKQRETYFKDGTVTTEDLSVSSPEYITPYLLNIMYAMNNSKHEQFTMTRESSENGYTIVIVETPLYKDCPYQKTVIRLTQINEYAYDLYVDNPRVGGFES